MSSKLPLRRSRSIFGFLRDTLAIRRQIASAEGLVGYCLDAELGRRTFWTFSVWTDQDSLDNFATSDPRRRTPATATRTMSGGDIPSMWSERKAPVL